MSDTLKNGNNQLHKAYLSTVFVVGPLMIFPEHDISELSRFACGKPWAIITSDNPFSILTSNLENNLRRQMLKQDLERMGLAHQPASGIGSNGWSEKGFFIFDISLEDSILLGKRYKQNAILIGDGSDMSHIKWIK